MKERRMRIGTVAAMAMAAVGACFTLLIFAIAVEVAGTFAADHELDGVAWFTVGWIGVLGAISGLATTYLVRRIAREFRRAPQARS